MATSPALISVASSTRSCPIDTGLGGIGIQRRIVFSLLRHAPAARNEGRVPPTNGFD
jgi:hypothetical protein